MTTHKAPPAQIAIIQVRPALLAAPAAAAFLSIGKSLLYDPVQRGLAPKPRKISGQRVGWHTDDLTAFANALPVSDILPPEGSGYGRAGKPAHAEE